ncbi:uncharacterized protein LOC124955309 isoform X2 [Vespa velutina]|uniref:uncharacterized protein LOC124955309 isoform X2 n=1 Tax=Vespa velutina TaxID=202808 RepID=UPI001FB3BBA6|nr:uncharacterized protein LOC124955309 isoform X2 [Vespa velutina]
MVPVSHTGGAYLFDMLGIGFLKSSFNFLKTRTMKLGPHQKIAIGWVIIVSLGLYSFALSRKSIESKRYESMKARQRMRTALTKDE